MNVTEQDLDLLSRTLWGEARGESILGQIAVVHVVMNRARLKGQSITQIVSKDYQFSCWLGGSSKGPDGGDNEMRAPEDQLAPLRSVVEDCLSGKEADPTGGATHYFATWLDTKPSWALTGEQTVIIGNHEFYKGIKF